MSNLPIGVFDSGLGGLTVWRELHCGLANESLIYFGDGKNCPYGPKPYDEVVGYVDQAVQFLITKNVKMLVVACNAATTAAITHLRATYPFPIVGMEPAVKSAAIATQSGVIGILATAATLNGTMYQRTALKYAANVQIITQVGEGFVELVEDDLEETPQAREIVERAMNPMLERGADQIVLGCTHYPFLAQVMKEIIGERNVSLIDPAPAVVRRVRQLLHENNIAADADHKPTYEFFTAADDIYLERLIAKSSK